MHDEANSKITRHIPLTPEEDVIIRGAAEEAGMRIHAYIKAKALSDNVPAFDWAMLKEHTEALDHIAQEITIYTRDQNPNRWLFEVNLTLISDLLRDIKELEARLIEEIRKIISQGR